MIKAILMDFNGVIIDDEPIQHAVYREIFNAEGIEVTDEAYYSRLGMDDKTFVASLLNEAGKPSDINRVLEITQQKTQKWREAIANEVPLFHGVEDFVRKMAREFELGLVSMSKREEIGFVLEKTGLRGCFSVIVTSENVQNCKPDPECYRNAFQQIDLVRIAQGHLPMTHDECLVIEDSPPGVIAGKRADLQVLGVTNTVIADELRKAGAEWVAKDLDDWMPDSVRRAFA
ncbi:MAG: HAD family phosphatase [Pyrinomonadaceae bacterium]